MQLHYSGISGQVQGGTQRDQGAGPKKVVLRNRATGDVIMMSPRQSRIARLRRRVRAWAQALEGIVGNWSMVMVTLTYCGVDDWRPNQIRGYMLLLRRYLGRRLLAYAWVAELQQRGAVHYHVLLIVHRGTRVPMPDRSGMWLWGSSRVEAARTIWYIAKYASKGCFTGDFPGGLRIFAVWISQGVIDGVRRWVMRLSTLPVWLGVIVQSIADMDDWPCRSPGGWQYAGRLWRSPWQYVGVTD